MPDDINKKDETSRLALWGILIFGFALRAAYVLSVKILPWSDMAHWDEARLSILHGLPYTAGWTPLYPALLALLTKLFGESYVILNMANAFFSALTCLYIYLCAKEVFGRKTACISLLISAVYIDMIWYCGVMLAETFGIFLLTVLVYNIIKNRSPIVNGIIFGLTCMTKGSFIICLPGFLFWIYYKHKAEGWLKKAALFSVFTFLVLLPWCARNFTSHKTSVFLKTTVLIEPTWAETIFTGHNPYATGGPDFYFLDHEYGKFYTDPSLTPVEKNRIFLTRSLEFALGNPLRELQLTLLKISKHLTFATSFVFYRVDYPARKMMFALSLLENMVIFPLCILGLVFSFRDKNAIGFAAIITVFIGLFVTLFCAETRKRMVFVPSMLILASYGATLLPGIIAGIKKRETEKIRGRLMTAGVLSCLLFLNFFYQIATRYRDVLQRFH
ncbi:MAG: glycosyltransferase family 39 protein [Elusimicrobia bacterium]|nr:glycosyltransferase family 39 protein [Elusimicrobiota bacterium]